MIKSVSRIIAFCIFVSLISQVHGDEHTQAQARWQFSLLFNQDECITIQEKRLKSLDQQKRQSVNDQVLHLNGVAYIDDQHWSLWLNNQIIDINHPYDGIEIVRVMPDGIVFKIKGIDNPASHTLHINQSININALSYVDSETVL